MVLGTAFLIATSNSATDAKNEAAASSQIAATNSQIADTNAAAAVSLADPVLALCAKSDAVAVRLKDAGLCGTAENARTVVGAPGRDGTNGIPGTNGIDGLPGKDGIDGKNGTDGTSGSNGAPGTFPVEYTETRSDGRVKHCVLEPGSQPPNYQCTITPAPDNPSTIPTS